MPPGKSLASKLQILALTNPAATRAVEGIVDWLLLRYGDPSSRPLPAARD
jgi:hypothetical protein